MQTFIAHTFIISVYYTDIINNVYIIYTAQWCLQTYKWDVFLEIIQIKIIHNWICQYNNIIILLVCIQMPCNYWCQINFWFLLQ